MSDLMAQLTHSALGTANKGKLLFFVTEDWYFVSHRLTLALSAQAAGYDVGVITRVRAHGNVIRKAGLRLIPFENARSGLNPLVEIWTMVRLIAIYRRERPAIVHHVALKPVIYGSIAARCAGAPRVINVLAGMGWLVTTGAGLSRLLKPLVRRALRLLLRSSTALVQNPDDALRLEELGVPKSGLRIIPGSGVDLRRFAPQREAAGPTVVMLSARLLWEKGVREFVVAARLLRQRGIAARFLLVGAPDEANASAVPACQISAWVAEGIVEYRGWVEDMPRMLTECHIVCLPSYYGEGIPKALIEAAAAGRAIVTTDMPGCREIVHDGVNGLLVPPRNADAVAVALAKLIENPELRRQLGARGRARAEQEFGIDLVIQQTLALYRGPTE